MFSRLQQPRPWLAALALLLVILAIYWPGLHGDFIFDDFENIIDNPALRGTDGSFTSLISAATSGASSSLGRPLSMASFALNFQWFGDAPFSFKLVNLLIHCCNAVLVFVLARQLWPRGAVELSADSPVLPAIWVAAVWALHPINLTPVLFVVQRMTSLSALLTLTALVTYVYGRRAGGMRGGLAIGASLLVCWPASILAKETGALLPLFLLLCEWLVLGAFRAVPARVVWLAAIATGVVVTGLCWSSWGYLSAGYGMRDFTLAERLMTQTRVLWFHVGQLLLPVPGSFSLFHDDIAISRGVLSPWTTLAAIAGWGATSVLAVLLHRRRPLLSLAIFWFLAAHALESTFIPLEIAYEHRNYLASFGIILGLASLLFSAQGHTTSRIGAALAAGFVLACALLTTSRASLWSDELQRTVQEVTDHPDSARANYEAARRIMRQTIDAGNRNPMARTVAERYLRRAADLDRRIKAPLTGLLYLDCAFGLPQDAIRLTALRDRFAQTRFSHADRALVVSLSPLLVEHRLCLDDAQVRALLDAGLSNPLADGPLKGMLHAVAMDHAAAAMHDIPLALRHAEAAVDSDPGNVALRINRIHLYLQMKKNDAAKREYTILAGMKIPARNKASLGELTLIFEPLKNNATQH